METLTKLGFSEYFSSIAQSGGRIQDDIVPPGNAEMVFFGCGLKGSDTLSMGVFGTPDELFDYKNYPQCTEMNGKAVRQFNVYYTTTGMQAIDAVFFIGHT